MLTRADALLAMQALEQLDAASSNAMRVVRAMTAEQVNAIIPPTEDAPAIEAEALPELLDETERANRIRFDCLYRALNSHLNDESVK